MNDFSIEDYKKLVEMAPSCNFINDLHTIINHHPSSTPDEIKSFLINKYPKTAKLFYEVSLRQIPLWINNKNEFINTIMTWRLTVNK